VLTHTVLPPRASLVAQSATPVLKVPTVQEFAVNGRGDDKAWDAVPWTTLNARAGATAAGRAVCYACRP